jgi:hypothetical protein
MSSSRARAGFAAEVALCSSAGMFVGVAHTWSSCDVLLSTERRNEQVFRMQCSAHDSARDALCSLQACNGTFLSAGSALLEHERAIGTSAQPFWWKVVPLRGGCVALYSPEHRAFLGNDLSLHQVPVERAAEEEKAADECDAVQDAPTCSWLCIPIPLKCEEGHADGYYSVTCLLHWGHDSAVLLTACSTLREPSVVKSIPCCRADAMRRIDALLYQANMPGSASASDLLCPVFAKMTSVSPSIFYAQKLCFRSLERVFAESSVAHNDRGDRRLPLPLSLAITRRVIQIVREVTLRPYARVFL